MVGVRESRNPEDPAWQWYRADRVNRTLSSGGNRAAASLEVRDLGKFVLHHLKGGAEALKRRHRKLGPSPSLSLATRDLDRSRCSPGPFQLAHDKRRAG